METVGVRELRQYATRVLARVRVGETIGVTDRGTLIAQISPVTEDNWHLMVTSGALTEAGQPIDLALLTPLANEGLSGSQALEDLRSDER